MLSLNRSRILNHISQFGVLIALAALILFGWLRYDYFLGAYNVVEFFRYNSMFALIALGMCFVIMSGGIDLSVGSVVALGSVTAAMASPHGWLAGLTAGVGAGLAIGIINGLVVTRLKVLPFVTTLATMLGARGLALLVADNQSVPASYETAFIEIGQGDWLGLPIAVWIGLVAYVGGSIILNFTPAGRHVLAVGGNEDASRLMGLRTTRVQFSVYALSGALAGLAGVILASQFGAGQPIEGMGWELSAIAAVVVGGTLLTGGSGSVGATLAGVLLMGLIFNVLNFENGQGLISLSAYWQSVIRGAFLLLVVILQAKVARRMLTPA